MNAFDSYVITEFFESKILFERERERAILNSQLFSFIYIFFIFLKNV